jgi:hypothetical protein
MDARSMATEDRQQRNILIRHVDQLTIKQSLMITKYHNTMPTGDISQQLSLYFATIRVVKNMFRFFRANLAVQPFPSRKGLNRQVKTMISCIMESEHIINNGYN